MQILDKVLTETKTLMSSEMFLKYIIVLMRLFFSNVQTNFSSMIIFLKSQAHI